jgi:circadian clock protein KaiC
MPQARKKSIKAEVPIIAPTGSRDDLQPTGIETFDRILRGGIPKGSTILLAGAAGTGKTILALQWLFAGQKRYGEVGIYLSATEYLTGSIRRAQRMSFYDPDVVGTTKLFFTDLNELLRLITRGERPPTRKDVFDLADKIFEMALEMGAKRIVIDSITSIGHRLGDALIVREFIYQLIAKLMTIGTNVIMTSEVAGERFSMFDVEEFIADGIISVTQEPGRLYEPTRKLRIVKMRGTSYNANAVLFRITGDGLRFFPREKGRLSYQVSDERITTGIAGLDRMTGGGYFKGSAVLLSGSSGAGKTIFALQCLHGALTQGEKCLFLSFEESREHLLKEAGGFGWNLQKFEEAGSFRILSAYPEEFHTDEHLDAIIKLIDELRPSIMVFDSATALHSVFNEEELHDMLSNLVAFAKERGVTMLITGATTGFLGMGEKGSDVHLSTVADAIVLLRQIEIQSELKHAVTVMKMRSSNHERILREFVFTPQGIRIVTDFKGYENVLAGGARKVSKSTEDRLRDLFVEVLGPMGVDIFEHEKAIGLDFSRVKRLLTDLGDQGIISQRRKEEFTKRSESIIKGNA